MPDGRLVFDEFDGNDPVFREEYWHQDHLGNTRVAICDFNNNGKVEISDDPNTPTNELEITQEQHYYPFGMNQNGNWYATITPDNKYLYNGKELNEDWDINLYEYGARWYDPAIGRFIGVDPIADEFPWVNTYNYAENEPVGSIDLHGLQKVSVNDIRNSKGQITSRTVNVSVKMKVLNLSSKGNYQFTGALQRAESKASRVFGTSFNSRVADTKTGLTKNKIPVKVNFALSTEQVSSLDQVGDKDFVMMVVDQLINAGSENDVEGRASINSNVAMIESDQLDGTSTEVLLHELGHNLGLDFSDSGGGNHTANGSGLMGATINGQYGIDASPLKDMLISLGAGGARNMHHSHNGTKGRAKEFFNDEAKKYDKNKANKAGF